MWFKRKVFRLREELYRLFVESGNYFWEALQKVKPAYVALLSIINYVLFPDNSYVPAAIGLCGALILDVVTKYYALQKPHGGFFKAIKAGTIRSERFWAGIKKKIIDLLVVMILCGLSVRVAPVGSIAVLLSNVAYSVMFLREAQSCIENLISAGHTDLEWLLIAIKRKKTEILNEKGEKVNEKD